MSNKSENMPGLMHKRQLRKQYLIRSLIWKQYMSGTRIPIQILRCNLKLFSAFTAAEIIKLYRNKQYNDDKARLKSEDIMKMFDDFLKQIQADKTFLWPHIPISKINDDNQTIQKLSLFLQICNTSKTPHQYLQNLTSMYKQLIPKYPAYLKPIKRKQPLIPISPSQTSSNISPIIQYINTLLKLSNDNHIDDIDMLLLDSVQLEYFLLARTVSPTVIGAIMGLMPDWKAKYQEEFVLRFKTRHYLAVAKVQVRAGINMILRVVKFHGWLGSYMNEAMETLAVYIRGSWQQQSDQLGQYSFKETIDKASHQEVLIYTLSEFITNGKITNKMIKKLSRKLPQKLPFAAEPNLIQHEFSYLNLFVINKIHYLRYLTYKMMFSMSKQQFVSSSTVLFQKLNRNILFSCVLQVNEAKIKQQQLPQMVQQKVKELYQIRQSSGNLQNREYLNRSKEILNFSMSVQFIKAQILSSLYVQMMELMALNSSISSWLRQNMMETIKNKQKSKQQILKSYLQQIYRLHKQNTKNPSAQLDIILNVLKIIQPVILAFYFPNSEATSNSKYEISSEYLKKLIIFCFENVVKFQVILVSQQTASLLLAIWQVIHQVNGIKIKEIKGLNQFINKLKKSHSRKDQKDKTPSIPQDSFKLDSTLDASKLWTTLFSQYKASKKSRPTRTSKSQHTSQREQLLQQIFLFSSIQNLKRNPIIEQYQQLKKIHRIKKEEQQKKQNINIKVLRRRGDEEDEDEDADEEHDDNNNEQFEQNQEQKEGEEEQSSQPKQKELDQIKNKYVRELTKFFN